MVSKAPAKTAMSSLTDPDFTWSNVSSWDDAVALFPVVISAAELIGDGAEMVDKANLVKVEFLILDVNFIRSEEGVLKFVSVLIMNRAGNKARFNDGGTGVMKQLDELREQGITGGIYCKNGLRVSHYVHPVHGESVTYYLAN